MIMILTQLNKHFITHLILAKTDKGSSATEQLFCVGFACSQSGNGCVSLYLSAVMDWQPVQGAPCLLPNDSWDGLQHPE